ncbi:MAG: DNA-directed RNA polymerase III, subunit Rpc31 [Benniella sp.]|nr:MAG: DNA-directed RNA polymerase III, subunit Rpc31 [Benniella sp.]
MSRGGGRGGGRGRGGAGAVIPMFGPDAVQATFKNPGDTYPDIIVPVARHSADDEETMYSAIKRLKDALYASPYYLTEPKAPSSIIRYTDRYHQDKAALRPKLQSIKTSKTFFPDELHSILDPKAVRKLKTVKRKVDLSRLDDNEDEKEDEEEIDPETGLPKKTAEGEEEVEEEDLEDEEDDEGNDYGESYFDNGENDVDLDGDEDAIEY